ncbi:MAG: AEC family transporter [Thermodesulfobacteriota bacterium]
MENFVLTITFLLIGMALRRTPLFPKETSQVLNLLVIHVSLPALVLQQVPKLVFSSQILVPIVMPWAMLTIFAVLILLAGNMLHWEKKTIGALLLLVPLGNTSFLGIPMVRALLGEEGVPYAVLYDQLGSFLALATYGSVVLAIYGGGDRPSGAMVCRKVLSFPPFLALLAALMLRGHLLPAPANALLASLAATLVPVVMIAVGFQLTPRLTPTSLQPLCLGLLGKLVVAPLLALACCRIFDLDGLAVRVAILESGMPPMVSAGALAIMAGLAPELTAAMIGLGILASFVSLPLLGQLL